MTESLVRPESWISEVLRINSHFGGINELEFGYSQLYSIFGLVNFRKRGGGLILRTFCLLLRKRYL